MDLKINLTDYLTHRLIKRIVLYDRIVFSAEIFNYIPKYITSG